MGFYAVYPLFAYNRGPEEYVTLCHDAAVSPEPPVENIFGIFPEQSIVFQLKVGERVLWRFCGNGVIIISGLLTRVWLVDRVNRLFSNTNELDVTCAMRFRGSILNMRRG